MGGAKRRGKFPLFFATGTWASSAKFPPDSPLRSACGAFAGGKGIIRTMRAAISRNDGGGGSESCGEKRGFGAAETFAIKTFAKSPAGHSGKRLS